MPVRTFEVPLGDGVLRLDADDVHADEAQGLLAHLGGLPAAQLGDDFRVDLGWSSLEVLQDGADWRLRGPDLSASDPTVTVDDVTPHLRAAVEQARIAALLGVAPAPIRFDEDITVEHGALEAAEIYLKRVGWPEDASGWHLGPLTTEASAEVHLERVPAYEIVQRVPAIVGYLALPDNFLIGVVDGRIDAVFGPDGRRVMGQDGELRIEAFPELVERAIAELDLTAAEIMTHSRHVPGHGYFLVWRAEVDPVMLVLHPNGEQLRLPTLVHPERVEQHWRDGDRTPVGYTLS